MLQSWLDRAKISSRSKTQTLDWGLLDYEESLERMREMVIKRSQDQIPNSLIFVSHPAVYTLGKGIQRTVRETFKLNDPESLTELKKKLTHPVVPVERGGGVTFHDRGQLIGYPLIKLNTQKGLGIHDYIRSLEKYLIQSLEELLPNLNCQTLDGKTGIWNHGKKVASIGIAVRRWVTFHGFAINLTTDLRAFRMISPCGFSPDVVGNLPEGADVEKLKAILKKNFSKAF